MNLEETVSLVTGGAKGLGLAIAKLLAASGSKVVVVDLDANALAHLPQGIEGLNSDVTNLKETETMVQSIIELYGRIDILINNAGMISSEPLVNIMTPAKMRHDYERFRKWMTINLDSVFITTTLVVEQMVKCRIKGAIINISSICASGNEGQTAYSAAKAAVNAMTVTWAKELGRLGIRCNAVAPGFIETDSTRTALSESMIKHIQSSTPLRRLGEPDEVAQAVISLITNDFLSGVILSVDGGLRI